MDKFQNLMKIFIKIQLIYKIRKWKKIQNLLFYKNSNDYFIKIMIYVKEISEPYPFITNNM